MTATGAKPSSPSASAESEAPSTGDPGEVAGAQSSPAEVPPGSYTGLHLWFALALAGVVLWWALLIWMAVTTANPVTLNFRQIAQSRYVVTAVVVDLDEGRLRVERNWRYATEADAEGEITVVNLAETGAREGETYLVPLTPKAVGYAVTAIVAPKMDEGEKPREYPRVYPATDEAVAQLESILLRFAGRRLRSTRPEESPES